MSGSGCRFDRRDAAYGVRSGSYPGPVEVMADLIAHQMRLLGNLGAECAFVFVRLVGDDGERGFQGMRQVANLCARAIDDVLIGFNECVELGLQRLNLGRQLAFEAFDLARPYARQTSLDPAKWQETETHLKNRDRQKAQSDESQRARDAGTEFGDGRLEPVHGTGDDDRIFRLVGIVTGGIDEFEDADRRAGRAGDVHPACSGIIGRELSIVGGRQDSGRQRRRNERAAWRAVNRADLPIPARLRHFEQRLVKVRRDDGLVAHRAHAVDRDLRQKLLQLSVEAQLHVFPVKCVNYVASERQRQNGPSCRCCKEAQRK